MATEQPALRECGVYKIKHRGRAAEFLVALKNKENDGAYSYALAKAVAIPGAGFTYDDSEFLIFVEGPGDKSLWLPGGEEDNVSEPRLFTSYHDGERLFDGRPLSALKDTGLVAVSPREAKKTSPTPERPVGEEAGP